MVPGEFAVGPAFDRPPGAIAGGVVAEAAAGRGAGRGIKRGDAARALNAAVDYVAAPADQQAEADKPGAAEIETVGALIDAVGELEG